MTHFLAPNRYNKKLTSYNEIQTLKFPWFHTGPTVKNDVYKNIILFIAQKHTINKMVFILKLSIVNIRYMNKEDIIIVCLKENHPI